MIRIEEDKIGVNPQRNEDDVKIERLLCVYLVALEIMSSTIPPLVCNTPPPIDSDHDDDDVCSEGIDSSFSPSEDGKPNHITSDFVFRRTHFAFACTFFRRFIACNTEAHQN